MPSQVNQEAVARLDAVARSDGWVNTLTGLGSPDHDKRCAATLTANRLSYQQLEELYRGDDQAARIVEAVPGEMCREWVDISIGDNKKAAEKLEAQLDDLDVQAKYEQALCWRRAYGGAGILVGANDGQDVSKPLRLEAVKSVDFLTVLDRQSLIPLDYYDDPNATKYGEPMTYRLCPLVGSATMAVVNPIVHESRFIIFRGVIVSHRHMRETLGWGDSVLQRVYDVLRDFQASWAGAAHLMTDFAQAVFRIKGLAAAIASDKRGLIADRLVMMNLARSLVRATVIDSEGEEFERKATPIGGLAELLDKFSLRLAAAADTPVTMLMGQAPAGLQATGASDIRWFYDRVKAKQRHELIPSLGRLFKILCNYSAFFY